MVPFRGKVQGQGAVVGGDAEAGVVLFYQQLDNINTSPVKCCVMHRQHSKLVLLLHCVGVMLQDFCQVQDRR